MVIDNILVTGATGLLGSSLFNQLNKSSSFKVRGTSRQHLNAHGDALVYLEDINGEADFSHALEDISVIIHTAARVHLMQDTAIDALAEYRKTNRDGTLNLAQQAAASGIRRFIFISSIKVNGERTLRNNPFTANDIAAPEDAYAISKHEAEQALLSLAKKTDMQVVIIRPPLIYGRGVKGNFARLLQWIEKRMPLPLGAIHNKRSFIGLDNLVDLVITCITHPAAANQIFLASDGEDLSTTELLQRIGKASGLPARLLPIPEDFLAFSLKAIGKKEMAQRLLSSLQIDIGKTQELLGWTPPISVDEGLKRCFLRDKESIS